MTPNFSIFQFSRIRPPIRRVLALDAGSRRIKLLLAHSDFGRLRILKEEQLDLQSEGLVSPDEIRAHLQTKLLEWDRPPLALVLPQHLSISQVVDVPQAPESEVEKLIQDETLKLSGVSESRIIYDFVRTETQAKNHQQFWVTLSQEGDIRERILRLGLEQEDLCEVTTTANALIAAYRASTPLSSRAILVHLGAETTVLVILLAGQGAFATSFQMGSDFFTRSLARLRNIAEETAEGMKRSTDLLNGADADVEFIGIVEGWVAELKRQLDDWFGHNTALASQGGSFDLVCNGGGFEQPGLLEFLRRKADLNLQPWPKASQPEAVSPGKGFEVAFGVALQALGYSAQPVSLLPDDYRQGWQKRVTRQRIEFASSVVGVLCLLLLVIGTWHQWSLLSHKRALLAKVQASQEAVTANEELTSELASEYENLRPVFQGQQNTVDTLKALALLQQSRSNRTFWYVLVADQQSYFSAPPWVNSTNKPVRTNLLAAPVERPRAAAYDPSNLIGTSTNLSPSKPGLIAELCVPEEPETARKVLSQLVNSLKQENLFSKVDLLSDDLRRNLADPKVTLQDPEHHFVLALDFAETEFQQPQRLKKFPQAPSPKNSKRVSRPGPAPPEVGDNLTQTGR